MYKIRVLSKRTYNGHYFQSEFDLYTDKNLTIVENELDNVNKERYPEKYEQINTQILKVEVVEGEIL